MVTPNIPDYEIKPKQRIWFDILTKSNLAMHTDYAREIIQKLLRRSNRVYGNEADEVNIDYMRF